MSPQTKRRQGAAVSIIAIVAALVLAPAPAYAYTTTGCKWITGNLGVKNTLSGTASHNALDAALNNYTLGTDVNLTPTNNIHEPFLTEQYNFGATGWEGQATWTCPTGWTTGGMARLNTYYVGGATEGRLRVVWLHEVGHVLGLSHVTVTARVMYTSASSAYNAGVRNLTSDEVAGINFLY